MLFFSADIESKLRQIEDDPEGAGTSHLYSVTQKISGVANRAFEPLFERQVNQLNFLSSYFSLILIGISARFLLECTKVNPLIQAQAEKIRSVQGMLQRFRTLFNLPSAIRGNIRKGEYDLAVREYQKAKSIVLPLMYADFLIYFSNAYHHTIRSYGNGQGIHAYWSLSLLKQPWGFSGDHGPVISIIFALPSWIAISPLFAA